MFWLCMVLIIIIFFLGVVIGRYSKFDPKCDGLFIVDDSGEATKWKLDIQFDPDDILKHKYLLFKVCKMEEEEKRVENTP